MLTNFLTGSPFANSDLNKQAWRTITSVKNRQLPRSNSPSQLAIAGASRDYDQMNSNACDIDIFELIARWRMVECIVLCKGHGHLARPAVALKTLSKLRGAMGHALAIGASQEALRPNPKPSQKGHTAPLRAPCPYDPPCAYELFHNAILDPITGYPRATPFTLSVDETGEGDLAITVRLFGEACDWASDFRTGLIGGLKRGLDLGGTSPVIPDIQTALIVAPSLPQLQILDQPFHVQTCTPILRRPRKGVPRDTFDFGTFFTGLATRLTAVARWHGAALVLDGPALKSEAYRLGALGQTHDSVTPISLGKKNDRIGFSGAVRFPQTNALLSTLVQLGQWTHCGSDTSHGAGRYQVGIET